MRIILTSFRDRNNWTGFQFSIARWNPQDCQSIPRLSYLAPVYQGKPMVHLEPEDFRQKYEEILEKVRPQLEELLPMYANTSLILLCWCNPDRQRGYGKLYCHRILLGYWIEENCSSAEVIYADGAENPLWERRNNVNSYSTE